MEGGAGTHYKISGLCDGSAIAIGNPADTYLYWSGPGSLLGSKITWAAWNAALATRYCWLVEPADCAAQQPGSALLRSAHDGSLLTLALNGDGDMVMRSQTQPVVCWLVEAPQAPVTIRCSGGVFCSAGQLALPRGGRL